MKSANQINVPRIVCRLSVHIELADDSEGHSPKVTPRSLLTVYGNIDDFIFPYSLSVGAELIINKLPLGTVERLIEEFDGKSLNIFAEVSGRVFIPKARQNLDDIAARYKSLGLKVIPVVTLADQLERDLHLHRIRIAHAE
jgi:hypothetical protein